MDSPFLFIGGPCVIESEALCMEVAEICHAAAKEVGFDYVFKASYDKANRTSVKSFRGPGIAEGMALLDKVKNQFGVRVTTDVHTVDEIREAAKVVDILQIPAFLCRQTDLIIAAAESGRTVNVKKGQFLAPWDVKGIADKLRQSGCNDFYITERGTTFGYNNLVVDMRGLYWMREQGMKVIFDATHSVQRPGGLGDATGGDGVLAPVLARAAVAIGIDGLFAEAHPCPEKAMSDGPNQIPLGEIPAFLRRLRKIQEAAS